MRTRIIKENKCIPRSFSIPDTQYFLLYELAKEEGIPISQLVRRLISSGLSSYKDPSK